jgi:glycosyltransferase involved in cell wall biosynthesis
MKVAFITRSTLQTVPGGDTVQILQTARQLGDLGITVDIKRTNEDIAYADYDLLHFFNIIRPADILHHAAQSGKPYVISTILVDYSAYDKHQRKGLGILLRYFSSDSIEYLKTVARWVSGKDKLTSKAYLWLGQRNSISQLLKGAAMILPNSTSEFERVKERYGFTPPHLVVPNGIDPALFLYQPEIERDNNLVICVARIEGIKNQLNLIKALNNTRFRLLLIGAYSPSQYAYYQECKDMVAGNIKFISHLPQQELLTYYSRAKVHVLPSWFETTGLSTLEAAAMGCAVVITDKGDTRSYFGNDALYCDPALPQSIYQTIETAANAPVNLNLRARILQNYTWQQAALQTAKAYQTVLPKPHTVSI